VAAYVPTVSSRAVEASADGDPAMAQVILTLSESGVKPLFLIADGLAQIAGALIERNKIERERLEIEEVKLTRVQKAMLAERIERRSR